VLDLVVTNGTVVHADGSHPGWVAVAGETIVALGAGEPPPARRTLDAAGCLVLPGVVDPHVHGTWDDHLITHEEFFAAETRSAACGGVTTVIDYAEQLKGETLAERVAKRKTELRTACIDFAVHCAVTDVTPAVLAEIPEVLAGGIPSFKVFTTYAGSKLEDPDLYAVAAAVGRAGGILCVHAENDPIIERRRAEYARDGKWDPIYHARSRPEICEAEAIYRVGAFAREGGCRVHIVHLSSASGLRAVREMRSLGVRMTTETCPQYLLLSDEAYLGPDGRHVIMSPPLRSQQGIPAMWEGIMDGTFTAVVTDHCPFPRRMKEASSRFTEVPGGIPGVETLLPLLHSEGVARGRIGQDQLVWLLCTGPAELFGLERKGRIRVGCDADLVVFDPEATWTIEPAALHGTSDFNPYRGTRVTGRVRATISRGDVIFENGRFAGSPARGRFVARYLASHPPLLRWRERVGLGVSSGFGDHPG
jgi:dihydropyrimidinase